MSATGDVLRQAGRAMDAGAGAMQASQQALATMPPKGAPLGPAQTLASLAETQVALMAAAKAAVELSGEHSNLAIQAMHAEVQNLGQALLAIGMQPIEVMYDEKGRVLNITRGQVVR